MTEKEYLLLLSFAHPVEAIWLRQTRSLSLQHHHWMLQPHHVKNPSDKQETEGENKKIKGCRDLTLGYDLAYKKPSQKSKLCGMLPLLCPHSGQGEATPAPKPLSQHCFHLWAGHIWYQNMKRPQTRNAMKLFFPETLFRVQEHCQCDRSGCRPAHDTILQGASLPFLGTLRVHCAYCM